MTTTEAPTAVLTLTDAALAKVAELIAAEATPDLALRVSVRPGGCSGLSYDLCFDTERADDDTVLTQGDVTIVVDSDSAPLLAGTVIDYTGGLSPGFQLENPNASRGCGCGKSFC